MEEKVLFSVTRTNGGVNIHIDTKTHEDMCYIAAAFTDFIIENPALMPIILKMMDGEISGKSYYGTVEMPDFNKLLHDNDTH